MLSDTQKAQAIIDALEENSPQLLAELAKSGELLSRIRDRVNAFNRQYVAVMKGRDLMDEFEVEEGLMPMLTEWPVSQDQRPLSPSQREDVQKVLWEFEESLA